MKQITFFSLVALQLGFLNASFAAPRNLQRLDFSRSHIISEGGYRFKYTRGVPKGGSTVANPSLSTLKMYEVKNGRIRRLGPSDCADSLVNTGHGKFCHWHDVNVNVNYIVFSSSDHSDPRTNGYRYFAVYSTDGQSVEMENSELLTWQEGYRFIYSGFVPGVPSTKASPMASQLVLYEMDLQGKVRRLGPNDCVADPIIHTGGGRYCHWLDTSVNVSYLAFSSSDGSDPRSNGYRYFMVTP